MQVSISYFLKNPPIPHIARTAEAQIAAGALLAYAAALCSLSAGPALALGFGTGALAVSFGEWMHPKVQEMPAGKFDKYDLEAALEAEPWLETLKYVAMAVNVCAAVLVIPLTFGASLAFAAGAALILNKYMKVTPQIVSVSLAAAGLSLIILK